MYKVVDIEKKEVYEFNESDDMIHFLENNLEEVDDEVILDDIEIDGVSTSAQYTILDMNREEKSGIYEFMEAFISNMDKLD